MRNVEQILAENLVLYILHKIVNNQMIDRVKAYKNSYSILSKTRSTRNTEAQLFKITLNQKLPINTIRLCKHQKWFLYQILYQNRKERPN